MKPLMIVLDIREGRIATFPVWQQIEGWVDILPVVPSWMKKHLSAGRSDK